MNNYKEKINQILITLLIILFPLNQQLHLRPFPSVDGFIIDYLITKISIPEVMLISLFIVNISSIFDGVKNSSVKIKVFLTLLFILLLSTTLRSNYWVLSFYENTVLLVLILVLFYLKHLFLSFKELFIKSIKFWLIFLLILGLFQFYKQSSVLDNYYLFGEFPYKDDHFHVKQKNIFVENMIPPYGIFSHSNILGGYVLILILTLSTFGRAGKVFHIISISIFLLVGSFTVLVGYLFMLFLLFLKRYPFKQVRDFKLFLTFSLFLFLINTFYTLNTKSYISDYSVYRRVYMVEISILRFFENPSTFFFGSGYFNYFEIVKDKLYNYELVRFFQPVHNSFYWLIWQYGFLFIFLIYSFIYRYWSKVNDSHLIIFYIMVFVASLDHYIVTNHQVKVILLLYFVYSINFKNDVKLINDEIKK